MNLFLSHLLLALLLSGALASAAIVHTTGGLTLTTTTEFALDTGLPPDILFTPKVGAGWEISRNWQTNKNASFMAYEGVLAQLLPPYPTLTGHWPAAALMWGLWWKNDGQPVYVGIFSSSPEDTGAAESTHHGWLRLSLNPDLSLTLHDWAFESKPDTPITAGAVPELDTWLFVCVSLACLILLRRTRTSPHP